MAQIRVFTQALKDGAAPPTPTHASAGLSEAAEKLPLVRHAERSEG
jgi:hypothetical protein